MALRGIFSREFDGVRGFAEKRKNTTNAQINLGLAYDLYAFLPRFFYKKPRLLNGQIRNSSTENFQHCRFLASLTKYKAFWI